MADDNENQPGRSAAQRKVVREPRAGAGATAGAGASGDPGDEATDPTAGAESGTGSRVRRRTPFWRTGRFWVAVILAEVAIALLISFALERSSTEVDLAGGDLTAFCAQVRTLREESAAAAAAGSEAQITDATRFERERDAYLALVAVAPPDLVADLERLAEVDDQIVATVHDIAERKAADPAYSGLAELTAALDRAGVEGRVAAARVDVALREGCGFTAADLAPPTSGASPATTAAPTVAVPGSSPR